MCELPRLFLPMDTVDKLVCSVCKEYLRYGPVMVKSDGESICGKCSGNAKHSAQLIHHKAFEDVITHVCFPCKYRRLGCPDYITFNDTTEHEKFCAFRSFYCPADFLSCSFSGTASQLPQHYDADHQDLLMRAPNFELKFNVSNEEVRLYVQNGLIFLIKTKISKEDGKIWIKAEYMGGVEYQRMITYKLILHTKDLDGLQMMMKDCEMNPISSATVFDHKDSQSVDINSLLTILENPSEVYCSIKINIPSEILKEVETKLSDIRCPHCTIYMAPPIYICPEGHTTCVDCTGYRNKCKSCNKQEVNFNRHTSLEVVSATTQLPCRWTACKMTCSYADVRRHEKTCVYKKYKCPRCQSWNGSQNKIQEHFKKEHDTHALHTTNEVVIDGSTRVYDFYMMVYGEIFGCSLFPTGENGKNISVWYYGTPSFYDTFEYFVDMKSDDDSDEDNVKTYQLHKCCATENCFSFNLKIPNEDIDKFDDLENVKIVFRVVENS